MGLGKCRLIFLVECRTYRGTEVDSVVNWLLVLCSNCDRRLENRERERDRERTGFYRNGNIERFIKEKQLESKNSY
jgi:hypothetical protein